MHLRAILQRICVQQKWVDSVEEASEYAERWEPKVGVILRRVHDQAAEVGRGLRFDFNSSSEYMLQGSCFAEPTDGPDVVLAKERRSRSGDYDLALAAVTPSEFEAVCRGILEVLGCEDPSLTQSSGDQGIDFYGQLQLEGRLANFNGLGGFDRRMRVWLVGQAKHYERSRVSTPDIRELVGSVTLARAQAYADNGSALASLQIDICDPVFFLFFTTGEISEDGWRLVKRSGMIGMDRGMVSEFLSDNEIGVSGGKFDLAAFQAWVTRNRR